MEKTIVRIPSDVTCLSTYIVDLGTLLKSNCL